MAYQILLAEDNPGDVGLFHEALKSRDLVVEVTVAGDGKKAIALVDDASKGGIRPDLIVLDMNLPKHKGGDVLRYIRAESTLRDVPVMILTSSESPRDHEAARGFGADIYVQKPADLKELLEMGEVIEGVLLRGPASSHYRLR